jgi:hypothetical protein
MDAARGVAEEEKTGSDESRSSLDQKGKRGRGPFGCERPEKELARFAETTFELLRPDAEERLGARGGEGPDVTQGAVGAGEESERALAREDLAGDPVVRERGTRDAHERALTRIVDPVRETRERGKRALAPRTIENDAGAELAPVFRPKAGDTLFDRVGDERAARAAVETFPRRSERPFETPTEGRGRNHGAEDHAAPWRRGKSERSPLGPEDMHGFVGLDFVRGHTLPGSKATKESQRRRSECVEAGIRARLVASLPAQPENPASTAEGEERRRGGHGSVADDEDLRVLPHARPQP